MENFADKAKATLEAINALRPADSNKGTFGHAYIIGGSFAYSGAPYLSYSASAAYRGGIGYAHLALPKSLIPAYMLKDPQAILTPMEEENGFLKFNKDELDALLKNAKGIAFGMGAGNNIETFKIAEYLLNNYHGVLLLDTDALNAIAKYGTTDCLNNHVGQLIITPHLLEFSRLSGIDVKEVGAKQKELDEEFARKWNCVFVLKSHHTYASDGTTTYEITSGNSGLAKAGSGDLLSGLIIGLSWAHPSVSALKLSSFACTILGKAAEKIAHSRAGITFATTAADIISAIGSVLENN